MQKYFLIILTAYTLSVSSPVLSMETTYQQPLWSDDLTYDEIEHILTHEAITELIDMRTYLTLTGKIAHYTNEVHLALLTSGMKAVFKPEQELHDSYAEVAAYRVSKRLGLKLVPPTVLRTHNGQRGSLQFFIESPFDLLVSEDYNKAFALLSPKQISDMYLFYYIFGQWDTHSGNQIIAMYNSTAKLALIDNGALSNIIQVKYGNYAYVKRLVRESDFENDYDQPFPFDNPKQLLLPTSLKELQIPFAGFPLDEELIKRWNNLGTPSITYVIWHNTLWIQFYSNNKKVKPNYTTLYYESTLNSYRTLNIAMLKEFFKEAIEEQASYCTEEFLSKILIRRNEVLLRAALEGTIISSRV